MSDTYRVYANKIPREVRLAIDGLHGQDDLRFAVIVALFGEGSVSFEALQEELDVDEELLAEALKGLQRGGLVTKQTTTAELGRRFSGRFSISEYGKRILDGFYYATQPKYTGSTSHRSLIMPPAIQSIPLDAEFTSVISQSTRPESITATEIGQSSSYKEETMPSE